MLAKQSREAAIKRVKRSTSKFEHGHGVSQAVGKSETNGWLEVLIMLDDLVVPGVVLESSGSTQHTHKYLRRNEAEYQGRVEMRRLSSPYLRKMKKTF